VDGSLEVNVDENLEHTQTDQIVSIQEVEPINDQDIKANNIPVVATFVISDEAIDVDDASTKEKEKDIQKEEKSENKPLEAPEVLPTENKEDKKQKTVVILDSSLNEDGESFISRKRKTQKNAKAEVPISKVAEKKKNFGEAEKRSSKRKRIN